MSHSDEIDPAAPSTDPSDADVRWPLVERRHGEGDTPPGAADRRRRWIQPGPPPATAVSMVAAPLWPFRLLAVVGAVVQGRDDLRWSNWQLVGALAVATVYAVTVSMRPVPYRDDARVRFRIVVEQALHTSLVMLTGAWTSPVALCLIPTAMLAGFASGTVFAVQLAAASTLVVTVQHLPGAGAAQALQDAALWAGLLGLVAFTSGLSQRAAIDAERQKELALARVSQLSEANSLLFALQRVAQSMPASLDLDDVVDSTFKRVRSLVPSTSVSLYLAVDAERRLELHRSTGAPAQREVLLDAPPAAIRSAIEAPRTVRVTRLDADAGLSPGAASGVYAALRARGHMIGLFAVESDEPDAFTQQHSEIVHGLAEAFGIAIDNARLFRQIRSVSANEERGRIARDLHDQVGSSLAFLGFEVDRAQSLAERGEPVAEALVELRAHLTTVIHDIRETLHDLRTDVTDERDLPATLRSHLDRVAARRALRTDLVVDARVRPPHRVERELWQIALEAITNVERHARAATVTVAYVAHDGRVRLSVTDDGVGLNTVASAADRYGMVGMRERAEAIGATLRVDSAPGRGTTVAVELEVDEAGR